MSNMQTEFVLAAVQAAPVYLDRDASIDKACDLIAQAGFQGADLAVFGETWVPGYASFARHLGHPIAMEMCKELVLNGVEIPSIHTDRLCEAAKRAGTDVAIGVAELDRGTLGTIYCTLLLIGREGIILGRHRKLKPTFWERAVWGEGDGSSLVTYDRPYARIGGLICWEHQMMLPGYSLIAQGLQVHAGAWPGISSDSYRQLVLSRAFAMQAGAYVVLAGNLCRDEDIPERFRDVVLRGDGGSAIIGPDGTLLAGPLRDSECILTVKADLGSVAFAKLIADHGGHYSRPDIFDLRVNVSPKQPLTLESLRSTDSTRSPRALHGPLEPDAVRSTTGPRSSTDAGRDGTLCP